MQVKLNAMTDTKHNSPFCFIEPLSKMITQNAPEEEGDDGKEESMIL